MVDVKDRVISLEVAREVLWYLGDYTWGVEPSRARQIQIRAIDEQVANVSLALAGEYAVALRDGRKSWGLEWLRSFVTADLDRRLDVLAELGQERRIARERVVS